MSWLFISFSCASVYLGTLSSDWCSPSYHIHDARFRFIRGTLITAVYTSEVKINSTTHRNLIMSNNVCLLVLDRVRHFRPIPIHRFFDTLQERTWRRVTDRSKAPDDAAATNNSGVPRTRCSAAADAFDLSWTVKHSNYQ